MDNMEKKTFCPETGLPIYQKPKWIDMELGKDYKTSISIVGDNILYNEPFGYATLTDIQQEVIIIKEVVDEVFGDVRPLVAVLNHSNFKGISIAARKYFIDYHRNQNRILGAIFTNISIPTRISIKLAIKLYKFDFQLFISKNYSEAINLASLLLSPETLESQGISNEEGNTPELWASEESIDSLYTPIRSNRDVSKKNAWYFKLGDYTNHYELIDDDIAHSVPEGYLDEKGLDFLLDRMTKEFVKAGIVDKPHYYIVGYGKLDGTSRTARKRYIQFLLEWYKLYPFKAYIIYDASRFVRTVINIYKHFIPFRIVIVKNFQSALEFVAVDKANNSKEIDAKKTLTKKDKRYKSDQDKGAVDELLKYLGDIDWEMDSSNSPVPPVDPEHPYSQVFDAISFIKTDIDQLLKERNQAEETVRENVRKYQRLISNVSDFVYYHDLDGKFTETNFYSKRDLGITEKELIDKNLRIFIPEKYRNEFDVYLKNIKENGHDEGIVRVMKKDGSEMMVEYRNSLVCGSEGIPIGVHGIASDITDKIIAKRALRESEEKYKNILESIEEGYYEVDLEGNITFFNDPLCRMLKYSRDELMGMNYRDFVAPEHIDRVYGIYNSVFRTGRSVKGVRYEILKKDRNRAVIEVSISLIKGSSGVARGFRGIQQDVTKRIQDEKEKRRLETKLQQAQKMEAIGTLAGGVAHDLNNILSGILSYPDLILMDLPKESKLTKPLQTIKKSGEKAASIVQDLLTLARRGVSEAEVLNLGEIVDEYLKSPEHNRLLSFHPDVNVKIKGNPGVNNIKGSPFHLNKIIMNLVSNAVEAIQDNGEVIISIEDKRLDRAYKGFEEIEAGNYIVISVMDNGSGMCEKDLQRIFEPFYTKKKLGRAGTGLGMAVVWGTVKDHKGFIDVKSEEGSGTTISIYLPSSNMPVTDGESEIMIERYMGNGERVLIVDDVEEQREIASMMLNRLQYKAEAVSSGEEAVSHVCSNSVDIVVLDMIMAPGIDGLETYKRLLEINPKQKAIITSGYSETDQVKETQRLGAGRYIKKPYTFERLGCALREELDS